LRLGYFLNGDPFVDEWATMLVARGIWERGLPYLPSGSFYGHGLLFSYVDALFLALFGWTPVVAQLPSLLAGLLTIPLTYWVGSRLFAAGDILADGGDGAGESGATAWWRWRWRGPLIGLLGAALVALDPVAILWAGRARAYTLLQILVLLAVLLVYRRKYLAFALAFAAAVFAHAEASLLLPGFVVGLLLLEARRPRQEGGGTPPLHVLRQPRAWLALGICLAAVAARFWMHLFITSGGGAGSQPIDSRPALQPFWGTESPPLTYLWRGVEALLPFFGEPYRLAITLFFLVGLVFAFRGWRQRRGSGGYLLLYPLCLITLAIMLTVVGQSWRDPRYLFMLLPAFALCAGACVIDLILVLRSLERVPMGFRVAGALALLALLLIPPVPEALAVADKLEEGYGPTLAFVRDHWQPGDRVAGWAVPAIAVELGQVDYFAMQIRHEEFLMARDGVWVDRWVGAPLMDSVEDLEAALDEPGRLWFLTDEFRFRARYSPEFAQAIWDNMEPVYRYHYALAFLEKQRETPAYHRDLTGRTPAASFAGGLDLVGYDLQPAALQPGDTLTVTLHWQARDWVDAPYTAFLHFLDPEGRRVDQADGPPFDGLHPTDHWLPGERLQDERQLALPVDAPPGRYQLVVGWYDPVTLDRLPLVGGGDSLVVGYVPVGQPEAEVPGTQVGAVLDGQVELVGFDVWQADGEAWIPLPSDQAVAAGARLRVRLVWRALEEMGQDYTVFVHLEGPDGAVWAQHDGGPVGGTYPTSHWRGGELVADDHELVVSQEAAGVGHLRAGMYLLETMERLDEPLSLGPIEVMP
jgi:hypothetical protein